MSIDVKSVDAAGYTSSDRKSTKMVISIIAGNGYHVTRNVQYGGRVPYRLITTTTEITVISLR